MGWKFDKTREEWETFKAEVFRENLPRYKNPLEWHHLWIDFWVAFFSMSYTVGHVVGIGIPVSVVLLLWWYFGG